MSSTSATPLIADPTFERTVVLLLAHGPDGAFGVVLIRAGADVNQADFTGSEVVVKERIDNQRLTGAPLEPRSSAAWWTDDGGAAEALSTYDAPDDAGEGDTSALPASVSEN